MGVVSVKMPDEMEQEIEDYIEDTGTYLNRAEMIRDAIRRRMEERATLSQETRKALHKSQQQFERGETISAEEIEAEFLND